MNHWPKFPAKGGGRVLLPEFGAEVRPAAEDCAIQAHASPIWPGYRTENLRSLNSLKGLIRWVVPGQVLQDDELNQADERR